MVKDINNKIYTKLENSLQVSSTQDTSSSFFENYSKMEEFDKEKLKITNEIIKNKHLVKALLVLGIKKVTWQRELKDNYGISGTYIDLFIKLMTEGGFIIHKILGEIDDIYFETIIKCNSKKFYDHRTQVKVFTLTESGEELVEYATDRIKELTKNNQHFAFIIQEVMKKTNMFTKLYNKILKEETEELERRVVYPDGFIETRRTIRSKQLEKEKKLAIMELKEELLLSRQKQQLLTNKESNQLAMIQDKGTLALIEEEIKEESKSTITYDGMYSHLTSKELDKLVEGESQEEVKQLDKEYNNALTARNKELNKKAMLEVGGKFVANGFHNDVEASSVKTENDECMAFINSL